VRIFYGIANNCSELIWSDLSWRKGKKGSQTSKTTAYSKVCVCIKSNGVSYQAYA